MNMGWPNDLTRAALPRNPWPAPTADEQFAAAMNAHPYARAVAVRLVARFATYRPGELDPPRWRLRAAGWALRASDVLLRLPAGTTAAAAGEHQARPTPTEGTP